MLNSDTQYREGLEIWTSFWRENPHRFLRDYIGCTYLKPFQDMLLYEMAHNTDFVYTASRGQGKSEIVSWYACIMALLYPGIEIVISSGTKNQAKLMVTEKIEKFAKAYPRLGSAISETKKNSNEIAVIFKNGSTITCVTPSENSRGYRANILIIDEYRMLKPEIIATVLKRFLASNRSPKFLQREKYKDGRYPIDKYEPNKVIYMSSCWFKSHWSWDKFLDNAMKMFSFNKNAEEKIKNGEKVEVKKENLKPYFCCNLPYTLPLWSGFLPLSTVENEMDEDGFNEVKWMMEMEALFYGESEKAFYKIEEIEKVMNVRNCFYPDIEELSLKTKKYDFLLEKKEDGEVRVISTDVGEAGSDNDVYICIRCIPIEVGRGENKKTVYKKEVCYINHFQCKHPDMKAIYLKKLYEDFQADYVVMDTNGTSAPLYYACNRKTVDEAHGCTYPAWTTIEETSKLGSLNYVEDALPIVYSVRAYPQFNHECANFLRDEMRAKRLQLPLRRSYANEEFSSELKSFGDLDSVSKEMFLKSFSETDLLLIELTNLEGIYNDKGLVSIEKPAGGKVKRDRYSALSYGIWFCCDLENKNLNKSKKQSYSYASYLFKN